MYISYLFKQKRIIIVEIGENIGVVRSTIYLRYINAEEGNDEITTNQ